MATTTPQLALRKPAGSDLVDETADLSDNLDKIDAASQKVLGYAQVVDPQPGISAHVDLNGLSVGPVTVGTARRLKITASIVAQQGGGVGSLAGLYLKEGGTILQEAYEHNDPTVTGFMHFLLVAVLTPTPGAHTYKLGASTGTATMDLVPTAQRPAFILVEDIGAA